MCMYDRAEISRCDRAMAIATNSNSLLPCLSLIYCHGEAASLSSQMSWRSSASSHYQGSGFEGQILMITYLWYNMTCLWHTVLVWALNCLTCGLDQVILEMQQQLMQQGGSSRAHSIVLHALQGLHHHQALVTSLAR